jgi:hypothetical protein
MPAGRRLNADRPVANRLSPREANLQEHVRPGRRAGIPILTAVCCTAGVRISPFARAEFHRQRRMFFTVGRVRRSGDPGGPQLDASAALGAEDAESITDVLQWSKERSTNEAGGNPDTVLRYAHDLLPGVKHDPPKHRLLHVKIRHGVWAGQSRRRRRKA